MVSSDDFVGDRSPQMANPKNPIRERSKVGPGTFGSVINLNDWSQIHIWYRVPPEFDLELPRASDWVNNLPLGQLGIYEEVL